jgi:hypothetical protein
MELPGRSRSVLKSGGYFLLIPKDGTTRIQSADLDEAGRFGDWPEDFDEVALVSENRYLSAAEARLTPK